MFSLEFLIMMCVIVLVFGALLGAFISRQLLPPQQKRELEQQLDTAQKELSGYQHEVAEHFIQTSKLVNDLTQSYKNVHEHLAQGAIELTNPDISKQVLEAGEGKLGIESGEQDSEKTEETNYEPPKDWAPKAPGESGQLSEDFGLKEEAKNSEQKANNN